MTIVRRISTSATLLLLALLASSSAASAEPDLVILHINDTHGRMLAGDREGNVPGVAPRLAVMVAEARKAHPGRVLLTHSGDIVSKAGPLTRHTGGVANIRIMNQIGFDVLTPGNGEFYFGMRNLIRAQGVADFPVIHANAIQVDSGLPFLAPYTVREVNGLKVGILGLGIVRMNDAIARDVSMGDPIEEARKHLPRLREQSDIVILLCHLGYARDHEVAKTLPGVDLVVGGHSHSMLKEPVEVKGVDGRTVYIAQAGVMGAFLGRLDIQVNKRRNRIERLEGRLLPIDLSQPVSAEMSAAIAQARQVLDETICTFATPVPFDSESEAASPAEQFAADTLHHFFGQDLSFFSRRIVRAGFEQGAFDLGDMAAVHPYRIDCLYMRLTGAQIRTLVAKNDILASGCIVNKKDGELSSILVNGIPLRDGEEYRVVMGAELYVIAEALPEVPYVETGLRVDEALADALRGKEAVRFPAAS